MRVHVISEGESIFQLANRFGVTPQQIIAINGLPNPNQLVVGQTLLIPTAQAVYTVEPGDTLWGISQKLGVSFQALLDANPDLAGQTLHAGRIIKLPTVEKPEILVNGYLEPSEDAVQNFDQAKEALTYLSIFSYEVSATGELTAPDDSALLQAVQATDVAPLMAITNIQEGEFSQEVAGAILNSTEVQDQLINNVLTVLSQKGYRGVNVDFEFLGSDMREAFNQFIERITNRLRQENYVVCTALAPKTSGEQTGAWYEAHDYAFHGQTVDFVILMTYEWGWSGGPPRPVSPITQVQRVINYALSVMPAEKIVMSIPLYGYDWKLPYEEGGEFATALGYYEAVNLAANNNADIQYDQEEEAPFFRYVDENGQSHIAWFQDLRTMLAMFNIVKRENLGGISFWNLAFKFPPVWPLLLANFNVRKV